MNPRRITLTVETDDPDTLTRTVETITRAMTGLALEGIDGAYLAITNTELEATEAEEQEPEEP